MWKQYLTTEEIHKSHFYATKELSYKYIITRSIVRYILSKKLHLKPQDIKFHYNLFGKPYIVNNPVFFNISHSNNILLITISSAEIGIDIEFGGIRYINDYLVNYTFNENEYANYNTLSTENKIDYFYNIWSAKESIVKLIGKGLNLPIKDIDLSNEFRTLTEKGTISINFNTKKLFIQKLNFDKNYFSFFSSYKSPFINMMYKFY